MAFARNIVSNTLNATNKTYTENNAVICEDTGHTGVTAFNKLVRDYSRNFNTGMKVHKDAFKAHNYLAQKAKYNKKKTGSFINPSSCTMELETSLSVETVHEYYGEMIRDGIEKIIINKENTEILRDTCILPFYKRCFTKTIKNNDGSEDKHTGEGERLLSYQMILELHNHFPETVYKLISIMPTYGYWGDMFSIWQLLCKRESEKASLTEKYTTFKLHILHIVINQLMNDIYNYNQNKNVSLLAKWLPREGSAKNKLSTISFNLEDGTIITHSLYNALAIIYANPMNFASDTTGYINMIKQYLSKQYSSKTLNVYCMKLRNIISAINKYLNTFEIAACAGEWVSINPKTVPSRAMLKYKTAYLNETSQPLTPQQEETGNRYPENMDRVAARNNLIKHILSGAKINISGVYPHEIMKAYIDAKSTSQKLIAQKQWDAKIEDVFNEFVKVEDLDKDNIESLKKSRMCKIIPMMDVSASMYGLPMDVSIGLGLFICGLQRRCGVQQIAIAFHENPFVFDFTGLNLQDQINLLHNNTGYSTNFESAIDLLLDSIKKSGEHKDLIVFTDGQFNEMNKTIQDYDDNQPKQQHKNDWTTCHQRILQKVASLGLLQAPNIIYWNLRDNTRGVQTSATHPGVQMLQGYTPSILKFALFGGDYNEEEITVTDNEGVSKTIKVNAKTPYDSYREALDQPCFDTIRKIISESKEGMLSYC